MPADPLDQLRLPVAPLAPRTPFAEELRRRLVAELAPLLPDRPEEETMAIDTSVAAPTITLAMPCGDARRMIDWMVELFGFVVGELHEAPDGSVAHARLSWRTGNVFVSDRHPGPWSGTGPVIVCLAEETPADVDRLYAKAQAAGAEIIQELADTDYGDHGFGLRDPEGNLWAIGTHRPPVGPG